MCSRQNNLISFLKAERISTHGKSKLNHGFTGVKPKGPVHVHIQLKRLSEGEKQHRIHGMIRKPTDTISFKKCKHNIIFKMKVDKNE